MLDFMGNAIHTRVTFCSHLYHIFKELSNNSYHTYKKEHVFYLVV